MQVFFSIFWWIYFFIFFSGYPLIYVLLYVIAKNKRAQHMVKEIIFPILPIAYALVSTCFWLLMLYTGKMNFVIERIASVTPSALIIIYSFSALLFWWPRFRTKTYWSFLHSLLPFMLPVFNMASRLSRHKAIPEDYIADLLRIYAAAVIIYIAAIIFLLAVKWLLMKMLVLKHHKA
jgi:hypothetical protein